MAPQTFIAGAAGLAAIGAFYALRKKESNPNLSIDSSRVGGAVVGVGAGMMPSSPTTGSRETPSAKGLSTRRVSWTFETRPTYTKEKVWAHNMTQLNTK
ncbi:hypothetical protein HK102_002694 [Quaeritorhiza haematococci]|nr:hypothetical protein HK102_002694 [Quaeritorhiza haematococci]